MSDPKNIIDNVLTNRAARTTAGAAGRGGFQNDAVDIQSLPIGQQIALLGMDRTNQLANQGVGTREVIRDFNNPSGPVTASKDAVVGFGTGAVKMASDLAALGLRGGAIIADGVGSDVGLGRNNLVRQGFDYLQEKAEDFGQGARELGHSLQSRQANREREISGASSVLEGVRSQRQADAEVEAGANPMIANLRRIGRDAISSTTRLTSDPTLAANLVGEGIGSLVGGSAKLAQGGARVGAWVGKNLTNRGVSQTAEAFGRAAGAGVGVGIAESSGARSQTAEDALKEIEQIPPNILQNVPGYSELVETFGEEGAKREFAQRTADVAFANALPLTSALGMMVGRFEAAPLGVFKGAGLAGVARNTVSQAVEEGAQGGIGQYEQNAAIQQRVNPDRDLLAGVGDQIGSGIVAGAGMAGVLGGVSRGRELIGDRNVLGTLGNVRNAINDRVDPEGAADRAQVREEAQTVTEFNSSSESILDRQVTVSDGNTMTLREAVVSLNTPSTDGTVDAAVGMAAARAIAQERVSGASKDDSTLSTLSDVVQRSGTVEQYMAQVGDAATREDIATASMFAPASMPSNASSIVNDSEETGPSVHSLAEAFNNVPVNGQYGYNENEANPLQYAEDIGVRSDKIEDLVSYAINKDVKSNGIAKLIIDAGDKVSARDVMGPVSADGLELFQDNALDYADIQTTFRDVLETLTSSGTNPASMGQADMDLFTRVGTEAAQQLEQFSRDINSTELDPLKEILYDFSVSITNFIEDVTNNAKEGNFRGPTSPNNSGVLEQGIDSFTPVQLAGLEIVKTINEYEAESVKINGSEIEQTEDRKAPDVKRSSDVTRSLFIEGIPDKGDSRPSIKQLVNEIFTAAAGNGNSLRKGKKVPGTRSAEHLKALVAHLGAKVDALNESNRLGGKPVKWKGLGKNLRQNSAMKPVKVNSGSASSVQYAKDVENNFRAAKRILEISREAHPDLFAEVAEVDDTALNFDLDSDAVVEDVVSTREEAKPISLEERAAKANSENVLNEESNDFSENPADFGEDSSIDSAPEEGTLQDSEESSEQTLEQVLLENVVIGLSDKLKNNGTLTEDVVDEVINAELDVVAEAGLSEESTTKLREDLKDQINSTITSAKQRKLATDRKFNPNISPYFVRHFRKVREAFVDSISSLRRKAKDSSLGNIDNYIIYQERYAEGLTQAMDAIAETLVGKYSNENAYAWVNARHGQMIDRQTGKFDEAMLSSMVTTTVDWMTTLTRPSKDQVAKYLNTNGLEIVDPNVLEDIRNSIFMGDAVTTLSKRLMEDLGVVADKDATIKDTDGVFKGMAKELISAVAKVKMPTLDGGVSTKAAFKVVKVPVAGKAGATTTSVRIDNLLTHMKDVVPLSSSQRGVIAFIKTKVRSGPSLGQAPKATRINKKLHTDTPTVEGQEIARRVQEKQPYKLNEDFVNVLRFMGKSAYVNMLGAQEQDDISPNELVASSRAGLRLGYEQNYDETVDWADSVLAEPSKPDTYFPMTVQSIGRYAPVGISFQGNKTLREAALATVTEINMNNPTHRSNYWAAVAQHLGIAKTDTTSHKDFVGDVEAQVNAKFGDVLEALKNVIANKSPDFTSFREAIEGKIDSAAALNTLVDLTKLRLAEEGKDYSGKFTTHMYYEIDGKTNGPANLIMQFGGGLIRAIDLDNLRSVGALVGDKYSTLAEAYEDGVQDLYSKIADGLTQSFANIDKKPDPVVKFFEHFLGSVSTENNTIEFARDFVKTPITATTYGAGAKSILQGNLRQAFYNMLEEVSKFKTVGEYKKAHPDKSAAIEGLFNLNFSGKDGNKHVDSLNLGSEALRETVDDVTESLGKPLNTVIKNTLGPGIFKLTDDLITVSGLVERALNNVLNKELKKKLKDTGKSEYYDLTHQEYADVISSLDPFRLTFELDSGISDITSLEQVPTTKEMANDVNNTFRQKPTRLGIGKVQVKILPHVILQFGDAAMVQDLFAGNDSLSNVSAIHDGLNTPITDVQKVGKRANQAVAKAWGVDILGPMIKRLETIRENGVKEHLTTEELNAFDILIYNMKTQMLGIQARKEAYRQLGMSVDQMAGSENSFKVGNPKPADVDSINKLIARSLDKLYAANPTPEPRKTTAKVVTTIENPDGTKKTIRKPITARGKTTLYTQDTDGEVTSSQGSEVSSEANDISSTVSDVESAAPQEEQGERVLSGKLALSDKAKVETAEALLDIFHKKADAMPPKIRQIWKKLSPYFRNLNIVYDPASNHSNPKDMVSYYDPYDGKVVLRDRQRSTVLHELIHATTYQTILNYYENGTQSTTTRTGVAVESLNKLKVDFVDKMRSVKNPSASLAKMLSSIAGVEASNTPASKAKGLNEFMAWVLSDNHLIDRTSKIAETDSSYLKNLTNKVKQAIKRILNIQDITMLDGILFNTLEILEDTFDPTPDGDGSGGNGSGGSNGTGDNGSGGRGRNPFAPRSSDNTASGYWFQRAQKAIDAQEKKLTTLQQSKDPPDFETTMKESITHKRIERESIDSLNSILEAGFILSPLEQADFKGAYWLLSIGRQLPVQTTQSANNIAKRIINEQSYDSKLKALMGSHKGGDNILHRKLISLLLVSPVFRELSTKELAKETTSFLEKYIQSLVNSDQAMKDIAHARLMAERGKEYTYLQGIYSGLNVGDNVLREQLSSVIDFSNKFSKKLQEKTDNKYVDMAASLFRAGISSLDYNNKGTAAKTVKNIVYDETLTQTANSFLPIKELVTEIIGTDSFNAKMISLLDRANKDVALARQRFRRDIPDSLYRLTNSSEKDVSWKAATKLFASTGLYALEDSTMMGRVVRSIQYRTFIEQGLLKDIAATPGLTDHEGLLESIDNLTEYMTHGIGNIDLIPNAYNMAFQFGELHLNQDFVKKLEQLISIKALRKVQKSEPKLHRDLTFDAEELVFNLLVRIKKAEEDKLPTHKARMNSYFGFLNDDTSSSTNIIISHNEDITSYEKLGYTKLSNWDSGGEWVHMKSTIPAKSRYTQGAMRMIRGSYNGVDVNSGYSVIGRTSTHEIASSDTELGNVIPVYDDDGNVEAYQRLVDKTLADKYTKPIDNLAVMLGAAAGRQLEEKTSYRYNVLIVDELARLWNNTPPHEEQLFINLADPGVRKKNPTLDETWSMIPNGVKEYIESAFLEGDFWVKKDMVNLTLGYREARLLDLWTGKSNLPPGVQKAIKGSVNAVFGSKGASYLSKYGQAWQGVVSTAKDFILIRSLIIPAFNLRSNVVQLHTAGVSTRQTVEGFRRKTAELETYMADQSKISDLLVKSPNGSEIKTLQGSHRNLSIWPLIESGEYKNIYEGVTEEELDAASGEFLGVLEAKLAKWDNLPSKIGRIGLISKGTSLYNLSNKVVQYGDFLAKSIYYDFLIDGGKSPSEALKIIKEEFVNFSIPPGRVRSKLESSGITWFMSYKLRTIKVALELMRKNPLRSLLVANYLGDVGSPLTDNALMEEHLNMAIGPGMAFSSPEIHPLNTALTLAD